MLAAQAACPENLRAPSNATANGTATDNSTNSSRRLLSLPSLSEAGPSSSGSRVGSSLVDLRGVLGALPLPGPRGGDGPRGAGTGHRELPRTLEVRQANAAVTLDRPEPVEGEGERAEVLGGEAARVGTELREAGLGGARRAAQGEELRWFLSSKEAPNLDTSPPYADFAGIGSSTIAQIFPARQDRFVALQGAQRRNTTVRVAAEMAPLVDLADVPAAPESGRRSVNLVFEPRQNHFLKFFHNEQQLVACRRQGWGGGREECSENALDKEVYMVMFRAKVRGNATCRVWTNLNQPATPVKYVKHVTMESADFNRINTTFYLSVLLLPSKDLTSAWWTMQSFHRSVWEVDAYKVSAAVLYEDIEQPVYVPLESRGALFVFTPVQPVGSKVHVQIMPAETAAASAVYKHYNDLRDAVDLYVVSIYANTLRYHQVTDWGFKADGTPGIMVVTQDWDPETNLYIQVHLKTGAPSNHLRLVVYEVGSSFESWKWWFGGVLFVVFVFCLARCLICRTAYQRNAAPGGFAAVLVPGRGFVDLRMGPPPPPPEETTSRPAPTKLRRVAGTLFARLDSGDAGDGARDAEGQAAREEENVHGVIVMLDRTTAEGAVQRTVEERPDSAVGGAAAGAAQDDDECCIVCLDRPHEAVLLQCGHGGLCVPCSSALWDTGPGKRVCPICRKPFVGVMRIVSTGAGPASGQVDVEVVHYAFREPGAALPASAPGPVRQLAAVFFPRGVSAARPGPAPAAAGAAGAAGAARQGGLGQRGEVEVEMGDAAGWGRPGAQGTPQEPTARQPQEREAPV